MLSYKRSSSAVRELRTIFENKENNLSSTSIDRSRSPSGSSIHLRRRDSSPRLRKVRTNFVKVEPMATETQDPVVGPLGRANSSSTNLAVEPIAEQASAGLDKQSQLLEEAAPQTEDNDERSRPENATTTTADGEATGAEARVAGASEKSNGHPNKSKTGKSPSSARSSMSKDLPIRTKGRLSMASSNGKPSSPKSPSTKTVASLEHLTKPTAASMARLEQQELKQEPKQEPRRSLAPVSAHLLKPTASSSAKLEPEVKPKPKTSSGPVSAHLLKPTASYAAKHESESKPSSRSSGNTSSKPVSAHLLQPTAASAAKHEAEPTGKPASRSRSSILGKSSMASSTSKRSSLAPSNMRTSIGPTSGHKSTPSGGFLERMTRPTAASSGKSHEQEGKTAAEEVKSPARTKAPIKTNKPRAAPSKLPTAASVKKPAAAATQPVDADTAAGEPELAGEPVDQPEPETTYEPEPAANQSPQLGTEPALEPEIVAPAEPAPTSAATPLTEPAMPKLEPVADKRMEEKVGLSEPSETQTEAAEPPAPIAPADPPVKENVAPEAPHEPVEVKMEEKVGLLETIAPEPAAKESLLDLGEASTPSKPSAPTDDIKASLEETPRVLDETIR